jgi:hypothetical protein
MYLVPEFRASSQNPLAAVLPTSNLMWVKQPAELHVVLWGSTASWLLWLLKRIDLIGTMQS